MDRGLETPESLEKQATDTEVESFNFCTFILKLAIFLSLICVFLEKQLSTILENPLPILLEKITSPLFLLVTTSAIILIFLTLKLFLQPLQKEISKSKLYTDQCSYIKPLVFLSALSILIFSTLSTVTILSQPSSIISALIILTIIGMHLFAKPLNTKTLKRRFAPEASNKDDLGFRKSAIEAAKSIKNPEKYVTVIALNGGYGEGKSSYARMLMEEVGTQHSLYSYISLTETNATKDFSKLFTERWFEALDERYPTINIAPHLASLEAILRESISHSALTSAITKILVTLNFGLRKTVAKCCDKNAKTEEEQNQKYFVPNSTAAMFNHLPEIKENVWIINIDEIERAQLDEIYRVLEVIERFKHEGRFGLPVKIVFLLCVSGSDLQKRLESLKSNEKSQLIADFFFNNPKSRDCNLFLPLIPTKIKKRFVQESLNKILARFDLKEVAEPDYYNEETSLSEIIDSDNYISDFRDETNALSWIINNLSSESPRMIVKVCQELEFFYYSFRDLEGKYAANQLAICDAICLSLIKMKYPFLIEVFKYNESHESYLLLEEKDTPKKRLEIIINDTFEDSVSARIAIDQIDKFINLVGISSYRICKKLNDKNPLEGIYSSRRTSHSSTMIDVLNLHLSKSSDASQEIYESDNHREALRKTSNPNLLKYSYDLAKTAGSSWDKHLDVAKELFERLEIGTTKDKKFILIPSILSSNSDHNTASYRFLFAISYAIEKGLNYAEKEMSKKASTEIWECIRKFLESDKITIDAKYIFLSGFTNNSRATSSTGKRLTGLFKDIVETINNGVSERRKLIEIVFEDANRRYFSGNKSIYENEENFAHVLFQSWRGKKDATENIDAIRKAAARGIEKYPQAVDYHWKITIERFDDNLLSTSKEFEIFAPEQLKKITEDTIELTDDQSLKEKLQGHLDHYQALTKGKEICSEAYIEDHSQGMQPLMMAMIDQGYIDESVSFFED